MVGGPGVYVYRLFPHLKNGAKRHMRAWLCVRCRLRNSQGSLGGEGGRETLQNAAQKCIPRGQVVPRKGPKGNESLFQTLSRLGDLPSPAVVYNEFVLHCVFFTLVIIHLRPSTLFQCLQSAEKYSHSCERLYNPRSVTNLGVKPPGVPPL